MLDEVAQDPLRLLDLSLVAPQGDVVAAGGDPHVVLGLERPQVLVVAPEQGEMIEVGGIRITRRVTLATSVTRPPAPSTTRIPRSRSWRASTGAGASVSGQVPFCVFGNAMTSRMDSSPTSTAASRSSPNAMPPMGGAPNSSASSRKPKRARASSLAMPIRREEALLDRLLVDADGAAGGLLAVQDEVVRLGARPPGIGLEQRPGPRRAAP